MFDFSELEVLADLTRQQARRRPDAIAHIYEDRTTTFAELDLSATRFRYRAVQEVSCAKRDS